MVVERLVMALPTNQTITCNNNDDDDNEDDVYNNNNNDNGDNNNNDNNIDIHNDNNDNDMDSYSAQYMQYDQKGFRNVYFARRNG